MARLTLKDLNNRQERLGRPPIKKPKKRKLPAEAQAKSMVEEAFALHLKALGIGGFKREHYFHDERLWHFDFAWLVERIAVEIEGGTRSNKSRHTRHEGFTADCEKYNEATLLGWKVFRFTSQQVNSAYAVDTLQKALNTFKGQ